MTLSLENYDQLCLVNDSCVLFSPLNKVIQWFNQSHLDFGGLTQSKYNNKHLQSYFLIFNKSTFNDLKSFFDSTPISTNIYQVIKDFEIGLSQYLISKNYTYDAFLNNDGYNGEYAPYYQCVKTHINQGSPMIKKKILFSSYRKEELFTLARMNFDINVNTYIDLIKKNNPSLIISFDQLLKLESNKLGFMQRVKFNLTRLLIQLYRKIK
jgi:lipopolysaccharide biosynthesis protein